MDALTMSEAAEVLGVGRRQVSKLVSRDELPTVSPPCGCRLIPREAVERRSRAPIRRGRPQTANTRVEPGPPSLPDASHTGGRSGSPSTVTIRMTANERAPAPDGTWVDRRRGDVLEVDAHWAGILVRDGFAEVVE